jgi:hypothetical protein
MPIRFPSVSICTALLGAAVLVACGSSSGSGGTNGAGNDGGSSGSSSGSGSGSSSGSSSGAGSGSSSGGSSSSSGGLSDAGGSSFHGGNPKGSCSTGVPAAGKPVDTSHPTTVVGTGTAASCTFSALQAAVTKGGIITFDCGGPATIPVTATLNVPTTTSTVVDGGNVVTLDGQGKVQIFSFNSPGWQTDTNTLTLQHLQLINAKTNPMDMIPPAPAPCSQGWDDGQGGAVYMRDGSLVVIDCVFDHDQAAPVGPDTGGGAIYVQGSKSGVLIVQSTFTNDQASNGGAVGVLWAELDVYDSLFTGNTGTGHDANNNDPSTCSAMNNGQNEVGSGGNGGALYGDGNNFSMIYCGDDIENNAAGVNAFGGGIFFTSDNMSGTLTIQDTTIENNTGGHWTNVSGGSVTNAGTAIGTNAKSITITNSMVQGVP